MGCESSFYTIKNAAYGKINLGTVGVIVGIRMETDTRTDRQKKNLN